VPFATGIVKEFAWDRGGAGWGGGGGEDDEPLMGDSLSTSIEFRPLIADRSENRFRCSGGKLRGCVSGSSFFRREDEDPDSAAERGKVRELRGLLSGSRDGGDAGR
jgi:hypothetical protein